jgi:predicted TIM-barrel fold metal-dependent hydrolase
MKINVHSHIFNLKSILTRETVRIMGRRAAGHRFGELVAGGLDAALAQLDESGDPDLLAVAFGDSVADNPLLRQLMVKAGLKDTHASQLVKRLSESIRGNKDYKSIRAAFDIVDALLDPDADRDTAAETLGDFLDFLRIGLLPNIDQVTDEIMDQLCRGDALVPLMMDIIGTSPSKRELSLFPAQLETTSRQILRYPGRVLPFVKANGHRVGTGSHDSAFDYVKKAVETMGFVGVKMYPSLGHDLDSVADVLKYCNDESLPVLYHCNQQGFKRQDGDEKYADPALWGPILKKLKLLKVCFAHFGGDDMVATHAAPGLGSKNWTEVIHQLMLDYPGRVFADISFNTLPMSQGPNSAAYLPKLRSLIDNPETQKYILWGTDFFMVRQRCRDINYEAYFRKQLGPALFKIIAEDNPPAFLGLDPIQPNLQRHFKFMAQPLKADWSKAGGILMQPAVYRAVADELGGDPPIWNPSTNLAQRVLATYLRGLLAPIYRKELKNDPDWPLTLADYQGIHFASYNGFAAVGNAFALEVSSRLKEAGVKLRHPDLGWEKVEDEARHWAKDANNVIGKLGVAISELVLP